MKKTDLSLQLNSRDQQQRQKLIEEHLQSAAGEGEDTLLVGFPSASVGGSVHLSDDAENA